MNHADRIANTTSFVGAAIAWLALAIVFLTFDPRADATALLAGALLLGAAVALTLAPVLWLATFVRAHRIAYRGDWARAGRRAALAGLVATLLIILRGQAALNVPLALFVIVMAGLVEVALSMRR
jgi:hypothetical protein